MRAPLLVIDGDSFAHRAYHALPKSIRRRGNKGAGAILGFANYLLRLYDSEKPRAVLVAWDTLDASTYRHEALPGYQGGREFDDELVDQLEVLPQFVSACGFAFAKAAGYEADDFLAAAVAREERHSGTTIVATGDRDAYQLASIARPSCSRSARAKWLGSDRLKCGHATASIQSRCRTSSPCAATARIAFPDWLAWVHGARQASCADTARSSGRSRPGASRPRPHPSPRSLDRNHGQIRPAAALAQPEAQLEQGRRTRAGLAAQEAGRAVGEFGTTLPFHGSCRLFTEVAAIACPERRAAISRT